MVAASLVRHLRGRHNSIRYRFVDLPKQELRSLFYRLTGRSWIDFYSGYIESDPSEVLRPEPQYLDVGSEFLAFLKEQGLQPQHHLLDYGCGILRAGLQLVPYLEPGRYVGVDISRTRLDQGARLMDAAGIGRDRYALHHVRDCALRELGDRTFDVVWAHAVLMHMPEADIRSFLAALKRHLHADSVFFFTYFPSEWLGHDRVAVDRVRDFYYPTAHLERLFREAGYRFELLPKGYRENWGLRARARLGAG